ncbi:hypothetical protein [Myroides sp. LoEW2-1]|uniref:hypothetical protein n=1 Tax=Myroides sp. LoEW2-1 TaxID=2683192 RepID=UPI00132490E6|nr:hypothetical protein [Myroides sp. LoEW2-1]MVX36834.1 hypothetical protein [Myroides sp. LoEW2-1]
MKIIIGGNKIICFVLLILSFSCQQKAEKGSEQRQAVENNQLINQGEANVLNVNYVNMDRDTLFISYDNINNWALIKLNKKEVILPKLVINGDTIYKDDNFSLGFCSKKICLKDKKKIIFEGTIVK